MLNSDFYDLHEKIHKHADKLIESFEDKHTKRVNEETKKLEQMRDELVKFLIEHR